MTGVPLTRLEKEEAQRLLELENELHKRVVSQDEAIRTVAKSIRRARSGLKDPRRPMGCFIFAGPSGVGKTLLSKALAEFMFGDEEALVQIDMSEYMEKHNVSRLIGAPPGYVGYEEGGQLTERIRRRPYAVVLLDDEESSYERMKEMLQKEVERYFRPEFLNRLDDVIVFKALTREDLGTIVDYELRKVRERLGEHGLELELTDEAKEFLINKGYNPDFGARPLRRAIEHHVEDPISDEILRGSYKKNTRVVVSVKETEGRGEGDDDEKHLYFEGAGKRASEEGEQLQEVHEGT